MVTDKAIDQTVDLARDNEDIHVVISFVCPDESIADLILDTLGYEGERGSDGIGRHNTVYTKTVYNNQTVLVQYDAPKKQEEDENAQEELEFTG